MNQFNARAMTFSLTVALASLALATPTYSGLLRTELSMVGLPPGVCAVCHRNGSTQNGTVTTPFGKSLRDNGLIANDETSLRTALAAIEAANTDSDQDGCSDIAELKAMPAPTNPNRKGDCGSTTGGAGGDVDEEESTLGPLRYGCGANATPGLFVVLALMVLGLRRRR